MDDPHKSLHQMRDALGELEASARKLKNQNFADLIAKAKGALHQASEHPDLPRVHAQMEADERGDTEPLQYDAVTGEPLKRFVDPKAGPTIGEWVAKGMKASLYQPAGYEPRSSTDEINAAIAAEQGRVEFDPARMPAPEAGVFDSRSGGQPQ